MFGPPCGIVAIYSREDIASLLEIGYGAAQTSHNSFIEAMISSRSAYRIVVTAAWDAKILTLLQSRQRGTITWNNHKLHWRGK
jgi:hypothetical protein